MTGSKEDFVFAPTGVKERKARCVAVNEFARQIERIAEAGTQSRGADALRPDNRILFKHDGLNTGSRGLASGCCACRPGADNEKLGLLQHVEVLG